MCCKTLFLSSRSQIEMNKPPDVIEPRILSTEERLRLLIDSTSDHAIFVIDPEGVIVDWNHGAERILGYTEAEAVGSNFARIFTELDKTARVPEFEMETAVRVGRCEDERWHVRQDGSRFWASGVVEAIWTPDRKLLGFAKILRDFTDRKQAEEALAQKAAELARSNRDLENFAYVASHDLKSPLKTISNYLGLAEENLQESGDSEVRKFLARATESCERLLSLIDALLRYSQVRSEEITLTQVDMATAWRLARRNLNKEIQESRAEIKTDFLPTVKGDEHLLLILLQNLLENALKYRRAEENPRIQFSARQRSLEWEFTLSDNGIGIDPSHSGKIFEAFRRLHPRSSFPGSGIGLAICQKIVERLGGRIWVESNLGKGSNFYFTLPAGLGGSEQRPVQ
jgi:PAS domain S-box-containing protein